MKTAMRYIASLRDRFMQSLSPGSNLLCVIMGVAGFLLFIFSWQSLAIYEDNRILHAMNQDADIMIKHMQFHKQIRGVRYDEYQMISHIFDEPYSKKYVIQLSNPSGVFFHRNNTSATSPYRDRAITKKFQIHNVSWTLMLWPTEYLIQESSSNLPKFFLIFGLILIAFLIIVIQLWQRSYKKSKTLRLIDQAIVIASDAQDTAVAMTRCLYLICETIDWPVGHIYLPQKNRSPVLVSSRIWYFKYPEKTENFKRVSETMTFQKGIGLPGRIWQSGQPAWIEDVMQDDNFPRAKVGVSIGVHAAVGFPIVCNKIVVAILEFFSYHAQRRDDELLRTFQIMSEQIGHVFERKAAEEQLQFIAYHDYLTGIANRAHFEKTAEESILHAAQRNYQTAIFILDLDGFKQVNDTFGHAVGDLLLQETALRFHEAIREKDIVARLGGDEFIVIVNDVEKSEHIEIVAKKLIAAASKAFYIHRHAIQISVSIGIALYPQAGDTLSILMKHADQALYQAKETGKNKYCFYRNPP